MKTSLAVDNYDWLKTAAILLVVVDHTGYFFIEDAAWWSVFGRMAAPTFFFLLGYAHSRAIPVRWLWLGLILTVLDSWNNDWDWVAPNILFSLALIRFARPYVLGLLQQYKWAALGVLAFVLIAMLPMASELVDYGSEGWLWALFGLCQRMYVDDKATDPAAPQHAKTPDWGLMRLLACVIAAVVYLWQEQLEFEFTDVQLAAVVFGVGALSLWLCLFMRGPSRIQPPEHISTVLRFVGRHTLEIYAFQLAGSELIINWFPNLAP